MRRDDSERKQNAEPRDVPDVPDWAFWILSLRLSRWQHFLFTLDLAYLSELPIQIKARGAAYPNRTEFNGERKMLPSRQTKG